MMYWVYLYADTFIWQNNNEYLIYNTSNNNSIYGKCVGHLGSIISGLHDIINLYCIEVDERVCKEDKYVTKFLTDLRKNNVGDYKLKTSNLLERPISLPPIPNVQSEINRRKDNMNFDYLSYINHIDICYGRNMNNSQLVYSLNAFLRVKPSLNIELPSETEVEINVSLLKLLKSISIHNFQISLTFPYEYYIKNSHFIDEISPEIHSFYITANNCTDEMLEILSKTSFKNRITIRYEISDIDEYQQVAHILNEEIQSFPIRINFTFFDKNIVLPLISFKKHDVLNRKLSKSDIYRHMIINTHFFGRLKVKENSDIISPCTEQVLSNIGVDNCWNEASKKECESSKSEWFLTRKSMGTICKNCLLNDLCPSPSEIEIKLGVTAPCQS